MARRCGDFATESFESPSLFVVTQVSAVGWTQLSQAGRQPGIGRRRLTEITEDSSSGDDGGSGNSFRCDEPAMRWDP